MSRRGAGALLLLPLLLSGCERPETAADPDMVSGASQPAADGGGEPLDFESAGMQLVLEEIASTGNVIWALDFIGPNTLIFTERQGAVRLLDLSTQYIRDVLGGPDVLITDSGGLFDVLVDPDFDTNQTVYFTYVKGLGEQSAIAVARSRLQDGALYETEDLFVANNPSADHAHWGSRVVMANDGTLYFTSGDRHVPDNAQNLASHGGKVLRINPDGSVPADNPFVSQSGAAPEVWSYGHRNPQGLTLNPANGDLFEQEHGPTGGDEINLIVKANNYGWPVITHGENIWGGQLPEGTERGGMEQPLIYFKPGIAPTGLAVYSSDVLAGWQGDLFSATLRGYMVRMRPQNDALQEEERLLNSWGQRMRAVAQGPDGFLYVASEAGKIARIRPAGE